MRTSPSSLFIDQASLPVSRFDARLAEELDQRTEFFWSTTIGNPFPSDSPTTTGTDVKTS
jgi:hypothetical protein